jgi:hyperosmotically inducible protein
MTGWNNASGYTRWRLEVIRKHTGGAHAGGLLSIYGKGENIMRRRRMFYALLCCVVLTVAVLGCQTPAGRSAGEFVDDATITTKVKAKLFNDSVMRGFAVSVKTFEGEVTLTGGVDTTEQKERASEIARSVMGVRNVNNLIKLK